MPHQVYVACIYPHARWSLRGLYLLACQVEFMWPVLIRMPGRVYVLCIYSHATSSLCGRMWPVFTRMLRRVYVLWLYSHTMPHRVYVARNKSETERGPERMYRIITQRRWLVPEINNTSTRTTQIFVVILVLRILSANQLACVLIMCPVFIHMPDPVTLGDSGLWCCIPCCTCDICWVLLISCELRFPCGVILW